MKRDSGSGNFDKAQSASKTVTGSRRGRVFKKLVWPGAIIVPVLIAFLFWGFHGRVVSPTISANSSVVAVLPFQNVGADRDIDFLRLALPDEIANTLSHAPSLSIRPFSVTSKYVDPELDFQKAGLEMHVAKIVTGHYQREGNQLRVTLEAIDVGKNRSLWRDSMDVSSLDMISMRERVTAKVRQELLPVLGASESAAEIGTRPRSEEAYDLYLRSVAVPHDPGPNKDAIAMLERVVGMDQNYAPAWGALGARYYADATYADGGEAVFQRSNSAFERALALDPNLIFAASNLITNHVERGELKQAYAHAQELLMRHPESAEAHFTLGYVLRYAGLLEQSGHECDAAMTLNPSNYEWRSCAWTFFEQGKTGRAMDFVRLDAGSEWASYTIPAILLREGKQKEARQAVTQMSTNPRWHRDLLEACLQLSPDRDLDKIVAQSEASAMGESDPELWYGMGTIFAYCGKKEIALRLIGRAIENNYCATSALKLDPLLASLRAAPEFRGLLSAANECQKVVPLSQKQNSQ